MTTKLIRSLLIAIGLLFGLSASLPGWADDAATVAKQVRQQWNKAKLDYMNSVKPYANDPKYAKLAADYTAAMNDTGANLDEFIKLKLSSAPPQQLAPAVDKLANSIRTLNTLKGQASGDMTNVLGGALSQHNMVVQNALKNMR